MKSGTSDQDRFIGRIRYADRTTFGVLSKYRVSVFDGCADLSETLDCLANGKQAVADVPADGIQWLPPLDDKARVFAVALNYAPHAEETGQTPPERPLVFYKPTSAFVGHNGTLDPHPEYTKMYDYEGEVGVVIGRRCSKATKEHALSYVAGVCAIMDGSSRDRLKVTGGKIVFLDWLGSKGADEASLAGPMIACGPGVIDKLRDRSISLETRLNDDVVQSGTLDELIFSVEELIVSLSEFMTLLPGDIIATGTPGGIGQASGRFLKHGDRIAINVSGLPSLQAVVR